MGVNDFEESKKQILDKVRLELTESRIVPITRRIDHPNRKPPRDLSRNPDHQRRWRENTSDRRGGNFKVPK